LAQVNETIANIGHLSDVANVTCSVPAATCAPVSHEGDSSISSATSYVANGKGLNQVLT
jgi:hypothetical protein